MATGDPYAKAGDELRQRYENRMAKLVDEQEKSLVERAQRAAKAEQDSLRAPRPGGGPQTQAPDLVTLYRKHERQYRDNDQRQRDTLTKEHEGEQQRLQEMQRSGQGQGMGAIELAATAMKPREQNPQREQSYKAPGDEFNRQAPIGRGLDADALRIEHEAAREKAIRTALGVVFDTKSPPHRGRDMDTGPER